MANLPQLVSHRLAALTEAKSFVIRLAVLRKGEDAMSFFLGQNHRECHAQCIGVSGQGIHRGVGIFVVFQF